MDTIITSWSRQFARASARDGLLPYAGFLCFLCLASLFVLHTQRQRPRVPIHGARSMFEHSLILQARFIKSARFIISSGYEKFKDRPFIVRRFDVDITILPHKYLSELRLAPPSKLSGVRAQVGNLVHKWTNTTLMIESDLHFRVIQNKLTAELPKYLDLARQEADRWWTHDIPQPTEWAEIDIQGVMRNLVARMTSRIFLGRPVCEDLEWLQLAIDFPLDTFTAAFTLRSFPPWMHPVVAPFIPARYRMKHKIEKASRILSPLMSHYLNAKLQKSTETRKTLPGEDSDEDYALLKWMIDHGNDKEVRTTEMATRQCILTLASIHTTSMTVANMLFDLCTNPEYFSVLLSEVEETTRKVGAMGVNIGTKDWVARLEKMDSFLVECQRFNPPILLAPQRVAMESFTLKDGTRIPQGSRISWAASSHLNDPQVTPDPGVFDPMRSYRKRYADASQKNMHIAGQTDVNNLTFGYGKLACPGRMFAVGEIKSMLARLLTEFDFKFPEGKGRPINMYRDENVFPDPSARISMRRKIATR